MKTTTRLPLFVLPFILMATLSLLYLGALAPDTLSTLFPNPLIDNAFIDAKLKYQLVTLGIAVLVLITTYFVSRKNAGVFYRVGNLQAPTAPIGWLGIKSSDTWKTVGRNFAVIISFVTLVFVYLNAARGQNIDSAHMKYLPFILIFAMLNAFTEEAITRLSLVTVLHGLVPNSIIYLSSALLFGIPHYFGVPGGLIGSLMAAFLGWLLSKSIVETQGLFRAWFIHFLQDVIIFSALFLVGL